MSTPEILNQQKYKKPADIYSFAITIYEVFMWDDAYPKSEFRFPWNIAEFVVSEQRLLQPDVISDNHFKIIERCWCHNPKERIAIEDVISLLETELMNVQYNNFFDS